MSEAQKWADNLNEQFAVQIGRPVVAADYAFDSSVELIDSPTETAIYSFYHENKSLDWSMVKSLVIKCNQIKNDINFPSYTSLIIDDDIANLDLDSVSKVSNKRKFLSADFIGKYWKGYLNKTDFETKKNSFLQLKKNNCFLKIFAIDLRPFSDLPSEKQLILAGLLLESYCEIFGKEVLSQIYFWVSVGNEAIEEIAKIRALRQWMKSSFSDLYPYLIAHGNKVENNGDHSYNNLINSSLSVFAAQAGKADALLLEPHDSQENAHSIELAIKQQILWKEEVGGNNFTDPVAGSYLIENRVKSLIQTAQTKLEEIFQDWTEEKILNWSLNNLD